MDRNDAIEEIISALLDDDKIVPLKNLVNPKYSALKPNSISDNFGKEENKSSSLPLKGIYCFWWMGNKDILKKANFNPVLQGKQIKEENLEQYSEEEMIKVGKKSYIKHEISWSLNDFPQHLQKYPLYIGKTSNLSGRIGKHLKLGTSSEEWKDKWEDVHSNLDQLFKPTTVCQLRSGMEFIFPNKTDSEENAKQKMIKNVGITFIEQDAVQQRFYLENLAIGYLRPWFNVDGER